MTGTAFEATQSKEVIFPKEKEKQIKKMYTLKLILCLMISNFSIYLLTKEKPTEKVNSAPRNSIEISLELQSFVPNEKLQDRTPVALYEDCQTIIVNKAHLLGVNNESFEKKQYHLEINQQDLQAIINRNKELVLCAYPYSKDQKSIPNQKRDHYEITF